MGSLSSAVQLNKKGRADYSGTSRIVNVIELDSSLMKKCPTQESSPSLFSSVLERMSSCSVEDFFALRVFFWVASPIALSDFSIAARKAISIAVRSGSFGSSSFSCFFSLIGFSGFGASGSSWRALRLNLICF